MLTVRPHWYFQLALAIILRNPKATVFQMACFPLFFDAVRQQGFVTIGAMAVAALTLVYGLNVISLTHFLVERLRTHPRIGRVLEKTAGVFPMGLGIKLAIAK